MNRMEKIKCLIFAILFIMVEGITLLFDMAGFSWHDD